MAEGRRLSAGRMQIDSMDGLRGLAMLLVFLAHTNVGEHFQLLVPFNLSGMGKMGVYLFFVLSSFLLTLPFLRPGATPFNQSALLSYAFRRFLRIYPLYFLFLLCGLLAPLIILKVFQRYVYLPFPFYMSLHDFFDQLLLIDGERVTWSIVVEFKYYFILPLVALVYARVLKGALLPSTCFNIVMLVCVSLLFPANEAELNDLRLGPYLPLFLMGSYTAVVYTWWLKQSEEMQERLSFAFNTIGITSAIMLILVTPPVIDMLLNREVELMWYSNSFLRMSLLWSGVMLGCLVGKAPLRRIFEVKWLRFLGFISFSSYLIHDTVVATLYQCAPRPYSGLLIAAIVLVLSTISWKLIEVPSSRLRLKDGKIIYLKPNPKQ